MVAVNSGASCQHHTALVEVAQQLLFAVRTRRTAALVEVAQRLLFAVRTVESTRRPTVYAWMTKLMQRDTCIRHVLYRR